MQHLIMNQEYNRTKYKRKNKIEPFITFIPLFLFVIRKVVIDIRKDHSVFDLSASQVIFFVNKQCLILA